MRIAIIAALCLFWLALAFRAFQRGDMLMTCVFLAVGILLTVYRLAKSQPLE